MDSAAFDGMGPDVLGATDMAGGYTIRRGGLSGQSGDMPPELYLKRIEQTPMYEREDMLDDHNRSTLRDYTCEAAVLPGELPRSAGEQDTLRSDIMGMRYSGARTAAEPIHPDLFLGFTERDPRGTATGPDFRKFDGHSRARMKLKDFRTDVASDWTVPESHRSELRVIRDIRRGFDAVKERMKIFSSSLDSRSAGGAVRGKMYAGTTNAPEHDTVVLDLNQAQEPFLHKNNARLISDTVRVGYRQAVDHDFKVAQYGVLTAAQRLTNIQTTRAGVRQDHKFDVAPSEVKARLFVGVMREIGRRKHLDLFAGQGGRGYSVAAKNGLRAVAADAAALRGATMGSADTIDLAHVGDNVKQIRVFDPVSREAVYVDAAIFSKVNEHKNITFVRRADDALRRNIVAGSPALPGDEVQVYVYSRKGPEAAQLPTVQEHKWHDADFAPMYKMAPQARPGAADTEFGHGVNPHADKVFDSYKKAPGAHWQVREGAGQSSRPAGMSEVGATPRGVRGRRPIAP